MGTRTIIFFSYNAINRINKDKTEINNEKNKLIIKGIPVYKHVDGYPSNILHLLRQYIYVNRARLPDISYLAAGFLRWAEVYGQEDKIPEKFLNIGEGKIENLSLNDPYAGYGLFEQRIKRGMFDGWEDYYYKITPSHIYCYDGFLTERIMGRIHPKLLWDRDIKTFLELPNEEDIFKEIDKKITQKINELL